MQKERMWLKGCPEVSTPKALREIDGDIQKG
jgi:hypothetical protein